MVSSRALASEVPVPPGAAPAEATTPPPPSLAARLSSADVGGGTGTLEYERRRDERIRENMERMQRLGIVDLALKFRSSISGGSTAPKRASNKRATPSPDLPPRRSSRLMTSSATPSPDLPPRRSSRLQNVTPVSYSEIDVTRSEEVTEKKMRTSLEEGPIEEVYTDEHEKLLGTCETSWMLFVDGYSKDGVRIYDQVKGKTCHQCRQKTLGHRTNCSKCNLVQGQFCGDCLYMRYGENVLEANKNPNWICPVCRGICNCSICRTKKGWAPTGILYKKILRLGFKSVAHFLIQTKRAQNTEGPVSAHQISAKRSLPFTDEVGPLQITNCDNNDGHYNQQMILFDDNKDKETECSGDADMQTFGECGSISSTLETSETSRKRQKKSTLIVRPSMDSIAGRLKNRRQLFRHSANNHQNDHCNGQIIALDLDKCDDGKDSKRIDSEEVQNSDKCDDSPSLKRGGTTGNKHKEEMQSTVSGKPSPNSIAGRLRYCGTGYEAHDSNGEKKTQSPDEYIRSITLENSQRVDKNSKENNLDLVTVPSLDGITGKQRTRTNKDSGCKHKKSNMTTLRSNRKPGNKNSNGRDLALLVQPSIDCIAGRLRSRGFNRGGNDWSVDKRTQKAAMSNNAITLESNGKPRNRKELTLIVTPTSVSIAERLRSRNKNGGCNGEIDITLESNRNKPNEGTALALTVKSDMDCIAGRLRRRSLSLTV